jgi:O-acetyl-ADP-ribose deacetylase (regulator of RNase III)
MIHYKQGNLLDVTSGIIVHGCNMQGVMGAGVAKAISTTYPDCFVVYKRYLDKFNIKLGDVIYYYDNNDELLIANALTQKYYGTSKRHVNYAAIVNSFQKIIQVAHLENFKTINVPKIGAGLAGGNWDIIADLIIDCDPEDSIEKICWTI